MRKIKHIIRLKEAGLSHRQMAGSCLVSTSTGSDLLQRAARKKLTWAQVEHQDDEQRQNML